MSTFMIALLAAIAVGVCKQDGFFGYSMLSRPMIEGTVVGLLLGDPVTGLLIGTTLEIVFLGSFAVGAAVSPDGGTAAGAGVGAAFAVPLALIGGFLYIFSKFINNGFNIAMQNALAKDNDKAASFIYMIGSWVSTALLYAIVTFCAVYFGSSAMEAAVAAIPTDVIDALAAGGNLLPAVGFALLMSMIMTKEVAAWYFIGFLLAAYLGLPTIAVTLIATAATILVLFERSRQEKAAGTSIEMGDDNEF